MEHVVQELTKYAELEGSEWGDTACGLLHLWHMRTLLSEEFVVSLEKEIQSWFDEVKANATIEEFTETTTHTYKELIWKDYL